VEHRWIRVHHQRLDSDVQDKPMIGRGLFFLGFAMSCSLVSLAQEVPLIGIDSNYQLDMEKHHKTWKDHADPLDPLELFAKSGLRNARIRLWVGDDGINRLSYATETARRAKEAGLKPYLVLFLSDDWADFVKQPVPAAWKDLSTDQKAATIEAYSERVVRHMNTHGLDIDLFEIGNEIDFGICGAFEEEWPKRVSLDYMSTQIWPRMVTIIKAAQAGVLRAQPKAKFVLHLSQWNNVDYCIAFWRAMREAGIQLDLPGLSYFPTSAKEAEQRSFESLRAQVTKIVDALDKPVLICEAGFPATADFGGQFADWKQPIDSYPMSEDGQARWIAHLVALVRKDPGFAGVFYWSPEWYDGGIWDAFALFDAQGVARPGVRSFRP
jgi:arabinogalactan endo-1,4-beta-galactosidase